MMGEAKWVEDRQKGRMPRPLRVEENLGLGIIQSRQGQPQPAHRYGSRMQSESEGILIVNGGVFMTSSCRLISG